MSKFFFSSRRRHTSWPRDWSSDVCSSDLSPEAKRPELSHTPPRSSVGDDPSIHTDRWRQGAVRSLLLVPVVAGLTPCLEVGRVEEEPPVSLVILQVMDDRAVRCWRLAYEQPAASLCLAGVAIPDEHLLADASSAPPCLKVV